MGEVLRWSFRQPFMVARTSRLPASFLCSQNQIPCQVPKLNLPSVIGRVREEPKKQALTWAGISSGPSLECLYGIPSGTILLSIISMSYLAFGSQFSFRANEADVCKIWRCIKPTDTCWISGICFTISSVIKWIPLYWGRNFSFFWNQTEPIWISLLGEDSS